MAAIPKPGVMSRLRGLALGFCLALSALPASGQTGITLEQLQTRKLADFAPAYEGRDVVIRGVVSANAYHLPGYSILPIQNEQHGGILRVPQENKQLSAYHPGDELEAAGRVSSLYGTVTVVPTRLMLLGRK